MPGSGSLRPAAAALPALAVAAGLAAQGCIRSRCAEDADCPDDEVCDQVEGVCAPPECVDQEDCGDDEQCYNNVCLPAGECGDGPLAPEFCGQDLNPVSPTSGLEVCVGASTGTAAALFFGTVHCGVCVGIFEDLDGMADGLRDEGLQPGLVFVQISTTVVAPYEVEEAFSGDVDWPVVQDTEELGIWAGYGAGSYDLVIVDVSGCIAATFGPLSTDDVDGDLGAEIEAEWRAAMGL